MSVNGKVRYLMWACVLLIAQVSSAPAHTVATGLEGFPAHMVHPILTTHQAVSVVAACVLASGRWAASVGYGIAAFAFGIIGGWAMQAFAPEALPTYWIVTYVVTLVAASAAVLGAASWSPVLPMILIVLIGGVFGLDTYNPVPSLWSRIEPSVAMVITVAILMTGIGWLLSRKWASWALMVARGGCALIAVYAAVQLISELGN